MKIRRIILKGVRNLTDFDQNFEDSWNGQIPNSSLLIGPNGSGKSTILNTVAGLWQVMDDFVGWANETQNSEYGNPFILSFSKMDFAAIEVIGLEDQPIWIYASTGQYNLSKFVAEHSDCRRIGLIFTSNNFTQPIPDIHEYQYANPGEKDTLSMPVDFPHARDLTWLTDWNNRLTENILGKRSDLPNLVYLASENRFLASVQDGFTATKETDEFQWLASYEPIFSRKGSLQNYLYNLKVVDDTAYQAVVDQVNQFLVGKRLNGFDRRTGNLLVKIDQGSEHPIEELSSGEKQVLLMLATITRWMKPKGIVLIDEPDLHLHVSLMNVFASHLRRMVTENGGQLIAASHSPELWRLFNESEIIRLGNFSDQGGIE